MKADQALFSPIYNWRKTCAEITKWVEMHRGTDRNLYRLDRPRPTGALFLLEFLEAYWEHGRRFFWRIEHPNLLKFEFDGVVTPSNADLPYPAYGESGHEYYRSIEDVNLVPNTYTSYFIFATEHDANQGLVFVGNQFP